MKTANRLSFFMMIISRLMTTKYRRCAGCLDWINSTPSSGACLVVRCEHTSATARPLRTCWPCTRLNPTGGWALPRRRHGSQNTDNAIIEKNQCFNLPDRLQDRGSGDCVSTIIGLGTIRHHNRAAALQCRARVPAEPLFACSPGI